MIKKIFNIKLLVLLLGVSLTFTSCFKDDSVEGTPVSDITIADFETSYTKVSYVGEVLTINPEIETGYADSDLEYRWTIVPVQNSNPKTYTQPTEISTEKNLNYEVNIAPDDYTVRLQVSSKSNSYSVSQTTTLVVTTEFSRGFYILKENAEGNSELDMLTTEGVLSENLLSHTREGGALKGAPLMLSAIYGQNYIEEGSTSTGKVNMICVTTKDKEIATFRSTDMKEIYNRSNMRYSSFDDDEVPYCLQTGMYMSHLFTSKGVTSTYNSKGYSGKFGMADTETDCSIYMVRTGYNICYWDQTGHNIYMCDFNGGISLVKETDGTGLQLADYNCVGSGAHRTGGVFFIMEKEDTKERVAYNLTRNGTLSATYAIDASKHIAKSSFVRVNALQGYYMYGVDGNKLYGYDWTSGNEIEMNLQGIGSGETITYVSNQYLNPSPISSGSEKLDYLAVGTQSGNQYHIYFYKMVGGIPDGEPVLKALGTGTLHSVRFITPKFSSSDFMATLPNVLCD